MGFFYSVDILKIDVDVSFSLGYRDMATNDDPSTSKVMKTENSISYKNISTFYQSHTFLKIINCVSDYLQLYLYVVTVKPVTRGHLNVKIGMSKLHFL